MTALDDAAAFGIDVALLRENLRRTPAERLRQLGETVRFIEQTQERTLTPEVRERLRRREAEAEVTAYGAWADIEALNALAAAGN